MTGKMFKTCAISSGFALSLITSIVEIQADVTFRTVTVTGDPAPGTTGSTIFSGNYHPLSLSQNGDVAFAGGLSLDETETEGAAGLWSEINGSLQLITRLNQTAPGAIDGAVFSRFVTLKVNGNGQIAFRAQLSGDNVNESNYDGFWLYDGSSIHLIARKGDTVPGTDTGIIIDNFGHVATRNIVLGHNGHFAFHGTVAGPGIDSTNNQGIWVGSSNQILNAVYTGDHPAGTDTGTAFDIFGSWLSINESGNVVFLPVLRGPDVDSSNNSGLWSLTTDSSSMIARTGMPTPIGITPESISQFYSLSKSNNVAFSSNLIGQGIDESNNKGVWVTSGGTASLVAQSGLLLPELGDGVTLAWAGTPSINTSSQVVFTGLLDGPGIDETNQKAFFMADQGELKLLFRSGDRAPGTADGVVFGLMENDTVNSIFRGPLLNDLGQLAFISRLAGPGISRDNNVGIFAVKPDGEVILLARTGNTLDVNDDPLIEDIRTIAPLTLGLPAYSNGEDGRLTWFNNKGQLLFRAGFTDGSSGLFVATIPEPTSVLLVGIGLSFIFRRSR